ncbi:MAG: enoyl-CoA hydratase-related protein [Dehalococcoidia bacterium]|nr:enoyl-CoA hydratase-related protein [Dehalococcoidia bacterium]MDP7469358.1 enoyl-CoA hydratase-related protein [Dehalococcoidia bacterium]
MSKVVTEVRGRSFIVTINRPQVRNAVDGETAGLLLKAVDEFRRDEYLDALIIIGAGDLSFCAGADLKALDGLLQRPGAEATGPMGVSRITDLPKPVIAAINGYCLAGGLELACWCDFRIADSTGTFGVLNRRWGVPLIDGGTQRLPRIVGLGNALYLIETGVQIDASQALSMGLVQEVVPQGQALGRALELAAVMSAYPQASLRTDRLCAYQGLSLSLSEGLELEKRLHRGSLTDPDMSDGLERFITGQRPQPPRPTALS